MKLQKVIVMSSLLMTASCDASDPISLMNAAINNLQLAQANLRSAAGMSLELKNYRPVGVNRQAFAYIFTQRQAKLSNAVPIVTNDGSVAIYLKMFDGSNNLLCPAPIKVVADWFSYLPANVAKIAIFDEFGGQLVAPTSVSSTKFYSIDNPGNRWSIVEKVTKIPESFTYTNSTTLPVTVSISSETAVYNKELAASEAFTQEIDPTAKVEISAHANLSGLYSLYDSKSSLTISLDSNKKLQAKPTSEAGPIIINNTEWPLFVTLIRPERKTEFVALAPAQKYKPKSTDATNIMISSSTLNCNVAPAVVKSLKFSNQSGTLIAQ